MLYVCCISFDNSKRPPHVRCLKARWRLNTRQVSVSLTGDSQSGDHHRHVGNQSRYGLPHIRQRRGFYWVSSISIYFNVSMTKLSDSPESAVLSSVIVGFSCILIIHLTFILGLENIRTDRLFHYIYKSINLQHVTTNNTMIL